ncbi:MAG TPA: acyl-CoA desaturase [Nocardioides sp.]|nr:acyl-CoA desaturase [Nocardioides sp.]
MTDTLIAEPRSPNARSLYTELATQIRESGLLNRRYAYYWTRISVTVLAFTALWVGFVLLGDSWFQLLLAGAMGVVMTQFGFLGHDAAHRQMFRSAKWNTWASRALAGLAGLSHAWWRGKHNAHHAAPNQESRDPDIAPGFVAFTPDAVEQRRTALTRWLARHQGWFFFPLLTLEGLNLHMSSVQPAFARTADKQQRIEAGLVALRLAAYVVVLLLVLPLGMVAAFIAVQSAVFGLCLGGSFAPNHTGMPIVPPTSRIDFLRRQVLMSRNVRGGLWVDFALGGLNYQIEHHLFPSMPRPNLRHARPLVRAYCAEHEVSYAEVGLFEAYRIIVGYLNNVGLRARGPFECPMLAQYRN